MTAVTLRRVDPVRNMSRFYRLDVQPDLFGDVLLVAERYNDEALAAVALQRQAELRGGVPRLGVDSLVRHSQTLLAEVYESKLTLLPDRSNLTYSFP